MLYSHTLPAHVIGCYDCTQPGFEDWGSTQAQSLILALFPVMIEDNSDQTSNLVSYRLIFKLHGKLRCLADIPLTESDMVDLFLCVKSYDDSRVKAVAAR